MLEEDIKSLYGRMADMDQPPSSISIPGAGRAGRMRMTRRRATVVATPVLAAVAVIAIALAAPMQGGLHGTQPTGSAQRAPQYFNPLRPYARFGWLPPSRFPADGEVISQRMMSLGNPLAAFLVLFAAGACHVTGHTLNCLPSGERYPLGRSVVLVDGQRAYWTASPGVLAWQYAVGGWAVLDYVASGHASAINDAVKIADHVRFGYLGEPAIRFPVQLTDVPANWQVNCVATSLLGHVMYAASDVVTAGRVTGSICGDDAPLNAPHFDAGQGAKNACRGLIYADPKPEVINGYQVVLGTEKTWPNHELCADDAAGTFVWIAIGAHPTLSPASIFAHHLRLLGSNPAKWTTKPIA
jgi:hypothetical protein